MLHSWSLHDWSLHDAEQPGGADPGGPEALVAELREAGGRVAPLAADFADPDAPHALVTAARGAFGHVDAVIAHHARSSRQPLEELVEHEALDGEGRALGRASASTGAAGGPFCWYEDRPVTSHERWRTGRSSGWMSSAFAACCAYLRDDDEGAAHHDDRAEHHQRW